jgi:phage-related minor tail protein
LNRLAVESSGFWLETRNALQGTQSALSDFIVDFGNLEGLIESVGNSFQRMFANLAAQMLMSGAMNLLVGGDLAGAMGFQNPLAGAGKVALGGVLGALFPGGGNIGAMGYGGSPLPSALGNVFDRGRVVPMANGMVIDGPMYFPLSGGRIGLMGEEETEAAVPLKRMRSGKLGVEASAPSVNVSAPRVIVRNIIVADRKQATLEAMRSEEGDAIVLNAIHKHGLL